MADKKLFLLDAYALAYRSYFAFIKNPRINSKGENTSAVFGFANTLIDLINKQSPTHIGVVFDPKGPTFRHDMFPEYKANREAMPDDLRNAIPFIKQLIAAFNIPVIEKEGFEADDVIGTLSVKAEDAGFKVFMMTPDKDYAQLVTPNVHVYKPARGGNEPEIWDPEGVLEKFKVTPDRIIDLLGLMGDSADNVPGCPGVGPKGAEKLIGNFGSIEGVYENIDQLKGKQKENLINFKEQILLSKKLVTIDVDVPVEFDEQDLVHQEPNADAITELFNRLEFRNMAQRVLGTSGTADKGSAVKTNQQPTLFDAPLEQEVNETNENSFSKEESNYILLDTPEAQKDLAERLLNEKEVCFDTETTSLEIHSAELVGLAFSLKKGEGFYIPFTEDYDACVKTLEPFKAFFEQEQGLKIGQNLKYDIQVLKNYGIQVRGELFDTMLVHYLIQPEQRHNLDVLAQTYLNYTTIKTEELIGKKGKNQLSMRQVDVEKVKDYACEDTDITLQLVPFLREELSRFGMEDLYKNIEAPLVYVLADMEYQGVRLDKENLAAYSVKLSEELLQVEKSIIEMAGMDFNISSPKQLGEVLFDHMKIVDKPKLTKTKQYSTSEDVLSKLKSKHPIVAQILEYRSIKKLLSTYVDALPLLVHKKTNKLHTSYNQTVTATGRLSSNNPNLQNIPIREERGRKIREAFVPESDTNVLLAADYSQIELRLMAHLCGDENMKQAFVNGEDIHAATASKIYGVPLAEVSREQRSNAKGANFGIIYGISAFGLSENLGIARKEAKQLIDTYFENYPKVKEFMDASVAVVRDKGYAETFLGRKRYLADIQSNNAIVRGAAERNAINAPIQGAAADIIKIAMIKVHARLKAENRKAAMLLQVHDELVLDVPKEELDAIKTLVVEEMERAVSVSVPLTVDSGIGDNWLQAH